MTNGEMIRKMSDEDMLQFFFGQEAFLISMPVEEDIVVNGVQIRRTTTKRFLDWMKEEAE